MKVALSIIAILVLGLAVGFFFGHSSWYSERNIEQYSKTYGELIKEVRQKELLNINDFVNVTCQVKTVDEGGLFNVRNVNYLVGAIENNALATAIKDIKLKVSYLFATESVIAYQEVTIYDIVSAGQSKNFKEKLSVPEKTKTYQFSLLAVNTD